MSTAHQKKIRRVSDALKKEHLPAAMLLSSAPELFTDVARMGDSNHLYRQDSDFFYLTGSNEKNLSLLISSKTQSVLLFAPKPDPTRILWEGKSENLPRLAARLGAELKLVDSPFKEIRRELRGVDKLYHQNVEACLSWNMARELQEVPTYRGTTVPRHFAAASTILTPLRLYKDSAEIELMRMANQITCDALEQIPTIIDVGIREYQIAASIKYCFEMQAATCAFETIAASGPSAATLHYHAGARALRRGDALLIDCGAQFQGYCADISRMFAVGGEYRSPYREICIIVAEAQRAALSKVRDGVKTKVVYEAAARILTEGLVELGVLRGKVSALMKKEAYKPYFPHGIGHSLGIDTHDVGALRPSEGGVLRQGMVFTIEPGLYFQKATKHIPVGGVRIEDNVLVLKNGIEILSAA